MTIRGRVPTAIVALMLVAGCGQSAPAQEKETPKGEKHKVEYAVWVDGPYDPSSFLVSYRDESGNLTSTSPGSPVWNLSFEIEEGPHVSDVTLTAQATAMFSPDALVPLPNLNCTIKVDGTERAAGGSQGTTDCHVNFADLD